MGADTMAIKIYKDGEWKEADLQSRKGSTYATARLKRRSADGWDKIYPEKELTTAVFPVKSGTCYGDSMKLYSGTIVCGSSTTSGNIDSIWTMLHFDTDFTVELDKCEILSVRLYLRRQNSSSDYKTTYVNVYMHNFESSPSTCKNRDYSQNAAAMEKAKGFTVGEGKWLDLYPAVGEKLRDGVYKGLSIDHGESTMRYNTGFYSLGDCKLEITYIG